MNIKGPAEAVFDTSVIIGALLESWGKEKGASRDAFNSIIRRRYHILRISDDIIKQCIDHFSFNGFYSKLIVTALLGQFEPENKIKKISYKSEDIRLEISMIHEDDRPVVEAAVAIKRKGITVCLVHKNPNHFDPIKEEMHRKHGILVLSPKEYVDP